MTSTHATISRQHSRETTRPRLLAAHHAREIKTTGDGFLASFDGPAQAVKARARSVARPFASASRFEPAGTHSRSQTLLRSR
jgi:class 3 adenylate cyclase